MNQTIDPFVRPHQLARLSATRETWEREYTDLKVIPTSTRTHPSRALLLFEHLFRKDRPLRVLDAGAGTGRNALYLAEQGHHVVAFDYAESALAQLRHRAEAAGLEQHVAVVSGALEEALPFEDANFDLVLDSYVSCHFLDHRLRNHFASEVRRVLKDRGALFSTQFSTDDEYYRELLLDPDATNPIVIDPRNGIAKQLYSRATAQTIFAALGNLSFFAQFDFTDYAAGRDYLRSIFVLLVEK